MFVVEDVVLVVALVDLDVEVGAKVVAGQEVFVLLLLLLSLTTVGGGTVSSTMLVGLDVVDVVEIDDGGSPGSSVI